MDIRANGEIAIERVREVQLDLLCWVDLHDWRSVAEPTAFFLVAVSLLTYNRILASLSEPVYWFALLLILTVFAWMLARVGRASMAIASQSRAALTDQPTGLGSGEALRAELAQAIESRACRVLLVIELDSLPHEEGVARDDLLLRATRALVANAAALSASSYRPSETLFALLVPAEGVNPEEVTADARAALFGAYQSPFANAPFGQIILPLEGESVEQAWQLVSKRLATSRENAARSPRRQAHAALLAALAIRRPRLREHLRSVVPSVISVSRQMDLSPHAIDDIVLAAGLQDIGLLSIPESLLETAGPISVEQRELLQHHPIAGERIVASASSLCDVAALVRSAYERFDGSGYPDGLAEEQIPLGSRIISACVALAAMTSSRPHQRALTTAEAAVELEVGAGLQFDPQVAAILAAELRGGTRTAPAPDAGPTLVSVGG